MLATTDTQRLKVLSKEFKKNIDEVQIHESENFVFLFEPSFWWFKNRFRISLKLFENILETRELTEKEVAECNYLDILKKY